MRRAVAALAFVAIAATPHGARAGTTATIVLDVTTFRNTKGKLGCQLYTSPDGFPDKWPAARKYNQRVPVAGPKTSCTFRDMEPGTYAAAVIHDENDNDKLDTNFLGIPTEGYGMSQNHTHALRRPTWDESKFEVRGGTIVTTRISLRY